MSDNNFLEKENLTNRLNELIDEIDKEKELNQFRIDAEVTILEKRIATVNQVKELEKKNALARQKLEDKIEKAKKDNDLKALKKFYKEKQKLEDDYNKINLANYEKMVAREEEARERQERKNAQKDRANAIKTAFGKGASFKDRADALKKAWTDDAGNFSLRNGLTALTSAISDFASSLNQQIDEIAGYKTSIDTRLQGWTAGKTKGGSYWDQMSSDITNAIGASPLVKQSEVVKNVQTMISSGIAYNVEQRAFLQTIKTSIADTFDANNGVLLRLVRLQQSDSTAARLGMESALNSFLNNMYENTEYLKTVSDSVKTNLEESMALMSSEAAVGYEYQVQKWLGSLYSVGMSQTAISAISSALGQLSAGNIEGITNGGAGNLLVMAAANSGKSISDILAHGLNDSTTNELMAAMVRYLAGIYNESSGNRVIQQQLAKVYGVAASDLKAAASLVGSETDIMKSASSYSDSMDQLQAMASSMGSRISLGGKLTNAWDNFKYTMSAGIANNAALYGTYKIGQLLKDTVGGIDIPAILAMGTGTASTFNVADLMMAGALGGSMISGIGSIVGSLFGGSNRLLEKFGINSGITAVSRGTGQGLISSSGTFVSESGYVGNTASGDVYNKTLTDNAENVQSQTVSALEQETTDVTNATINSSIINIYELLETVISGGALNITASAPVDVRTRTDSLNFN